MNKYFQIISIDEAKNILIDNGLNINDKTDYTTGLFINNKLVATGSLYKNIIKLIAIKKEYQKENLLSLIITNLITELTTRGYSKYFLFTEESNTKYFTNLGFKEVITAKGVSYLENSNNTIKETLEDLKVSLNLDNKSVGAVIVNCNPPTLGHLHLITSAAKNHDTLLVFLVSEDKSFFPYNARKKMLKQATKDLKNVHILPSTNYLISSSTFPSYFLKDFNAKASIEMHLDVKIFIHYFMPIFNIKKRYVGTEENDTFTNHYNKVLKHYLKDNLKIINRLKTNDTIISASLVRKHFKEGNLSLVKKLVPEATYNFLTSKEAQELLKWRIIF